MLQNKYVRFAFRSTLFITGVYVGSRILPEITDWYERVKEAHYPKKEEVIDPHYENAQHIVQFVYKSPNLKE